MSLCPHRETWGSVQQVFRGLWTDGWNTQCLGKGNACSLRHPQSSRGDEPFSADSLQPKSGARASGGMWHVGEVGYLWAVMWECGLDRKVPSQNIVGRVLMPAPLLPCQGASASHTHVWFHFPLCKRQGWDLHSCAWCLPMSSCMQAEGLGPKPGVFTSVLYLGGL